MSVIADTDGKKIQVTFPYDGADVFRAKSVLGARPVYDGNKFDHWAYPLTPETCQDLRGAFGSRLKITVTLADWYRKLQAERLRIEKLRAGQVADLPVVRENYPLLWEALSNRSFQITGAAMAAAARQFCLGDEPRLGKTYQALAVLGETRSKRVLIACPRTACTTVWYRKIQEFLPDFEAFVAQEDRANRLDQIVEFGSNQSENRVLIINKEMIRVVRYHRCKVIGQSFARNPGETTRATLKRQRPDDVTATWNEDQQAWLNRIRPGKKGGCEGSHDHDTIYTPKFPQLFRIEWDAVILDECHHAVASEKNVQSDAISQIRMGAMRLRTSADAVKLAMSGTPFRARAVKSWGVLNWLRPDVFGSFWRYAERHFEVKSNGYGKVISDKPKDEQAWKESLRPYYLTRSMADVAPDLPALDIIEVDLEMTEKQAKSYRDMADLASAAIENGTLSATGILAERTRLKQFACSWGRFSGGTFYPAEPSNKMDWILQFLEERKESDGKVVIASQFTKLVHFIADAVRKAGWDCLTLTGESNDAQRIHAQDAFLHGKPRVIVINMFAGGEAIDLSSADEMILTDEPDGRTEAIQQVINRIRNLAKSGRPLAVWKLLSRGTIEWSISSLNEEDRIILESGKPEALEVLKEVL